MRALYKAEFMLCGYSRKICDNAEEKPHKGYLRIS